MNTEQIQQAKELREQGESFRAIADELDVSLSTVYRALQEEEPQDQREADTPDTGEPAKVQDLTARINFARERLAECQQEQQEVSAARKTLLEAEELDDAALAKLTDKDAALVGRIQHFEARIPLLEQRLEDAWQAHAIKRMAELPAEAEQLYEAVHFSLFKIAKLEQDLLQAHREAAEFYRKRNELGSEEVYWVDRFRLPRTKLIDLGKRPDLAEFQREFGGIWHTAFSEESEWTRRRNEFARTPRKPKLRASQPQPAPQPLAPPADANQPEDAGGLFLEEGRVTWDVFGVQFTAGRSIGSQFIAQGPKETFSWRTVLQLARERKLPTWASKVPAIEPRVEKEFTNLRAAGEDPHAHIFVQKGQVTRVDLPSGSSLGLPLEELRQRINQTGGLPKAWDFPVIRQALGC